MARKPSSDFLLFPAHLQSFIENIEQVWSLTFFREELRGSPDGRLPAKFQILNKSSLVLSVACWEAFLEELVSNTLDVLLEHCDGPQRLPSPLKKTVASRLAKKGADSAWLLAGDGWKVQVQAERNRLINEFHTPDSSRVDELFERVVGIKAVTSCWRWKGQPAANSKERLNALVNTRHELAHRMTTTSNVTASYLRRETDLLCKLAVKTSNRMRVHLKELQCDSIEIEGKKWVPVSYGGVG